MGPHGYWPCLIIRGLAYLGPGPMAQVGPRSQGQVTCGSLKINTGPKGQAPGGPIGPLGLSGPDRVGNNLTLGLKARLDPRARPKVHMAHRAIPYLGPNGP